MIELAAIFRRYGPRYRQEFGARMPSSHLRAMLDIERCRTEVLGGQVYYCEHCQQTHYSYHSCQNRHCPKCQNERADQWLARQQDLLLPVAHFLVTFTLPAGLRQVARRKQKVVYNILFRTSAAALQELALDPRFVGGQIGMVGVLHTWGRDLSYHPHVHFLVPGGGFVADTQQWRASRPGFLVHVKPLSRLFRAKFRAELKKAGLLEQVPVEVWQQEWVVHSKAVANGQAALKYLAPYIFRVALSNKRIVKVQNDQVTFRYKDHKSGKRRSLTLPAEEFMRRFLQHVLPKGLIKVRYYGFFSPGQRPVLKQVRAVLGQPSPTPVVADDQASSGIQQTQPETNPVPPQDTLPCPKCNRPMRLIAKLKPTHCRSP